MNSPFPFGTWAHVSKDLLRDLDAGALLLTLVKKSSRCRSRRTELWPVFYPEGMEILAVARMKRPNGTHTHNRRARQLAESFAEARAPRARGGEGEMVPEHLSLED